MGLLLLAVPARSQGHYGRYHNHHQQQHGNTDRVPMTSIDTLTFSSDKPTNARRVAAVPQLKCVGGDARHTADHVVHVVQCSRIGVGYGKPQWRCEAELPVEYKLGQTTVTCEGYAHPDDPFVLRDSCGLEYTLHKTGMVSAHSRQHHSGQAAPWLSYMFAGLLGYCLLGSPLLFWGAVAYSVASMFGLSLTSIVFLLLLMSWLAPPRQTRRQRHFADARAAEGAYGHSYAYPQHMWASPYGFSPYNNYGYGSGGGLGSFLGGMAAGGLASTMFSDPYRSHRYRDYDYRPSFASAGRSSHTSSGYGGTRNR